MERTVGSLSEVRKGDESCSTRVPKLGPTARPFHSKPSKQQTGNDSSANRHSEKSERSDAGDLLLALRIVREVDEGKLLTSWIMSGGFILKKGLLRLAAHCFSI